MSESAQTKTEHAAQLLSAFELRAERERRVSADPFARFGLESSDVRDATDAPTYHMMWIGFAVAALLAFSPVPLLGFGIAALLGLVRLAVVFSLWLAEDSLEQA